MQYLSKFKYVYAFETSVFELHVIDYKPERPEVANLCYFCLIPSKYR